jgi:uncharacterized protein DUF5666
MDVRYAACAALLILSTAACGSHAPSSPSAPSPATAPVAVTGATVQGQVQSGALSGMTAATTSAAASGLTVTVVGTPISATVSGLGQFVLTGVPAGSHQLNFSGPGVNANVSFSPVEGTETISITVKISGNHAEVESEEHDNHGDLEINGIIASLTGSAGSFSFMVGSKTVHGDAQTAFFGDGNRSDTFATLRNGARVEVKAAMRNGEVYAQRIHINGGNSGDGDDHQTDDDDDDNGTGDGDGAGEAEASGTISALTPGCPSISFRLGSAQVTTNASTEFKNASCGSLKNGDKVKVEGTTQPSGAILAREVKKQ